MKKFKKMLAVLAASALVAAMPLTAMAASITITRNDTFENDTNTKKETYTYYKVLDVIKSQDGLGNTNDKNVGGETEDVKGVTYQVEANSPWLNALRDAPHLTLTPSADQSVYVVSWTGEKSEEGAIELAEYLKDHIPVGFDGTTFQTGDTQKVEDGYYLIESSLGTNLILATSDITIKEKNQYPSLDKTVPETSYNVGDKVPYSITVKVPDNVDTEKDIIIHDKMDDVLSFQDDITAIVKDGNNKDTNFTDFKVNENKTDEDTFDITLNLDDVAGKTVVFTYSAELLSSAAADKDYVNTAFGEYSNYTTPEKTPTIKTYGFTLKKTDNADKQLEGAQFELRTKADDAKTAIQFITDDTGYVKKDSDDAKAAVTISAGKVNVRGLKAGTYYLVETKAPEGYNMLTKPVEVTINGEGKITVADNNLVTAADNNLVNVVNEQGVLLPSTGGIGTTVFAVAGLVIMAGAAVVMVIKKRS